MRRADTLRLGLALLLPASLMGTHAIRADGQTTAVAPFVGNRSETWETFPNFLDGGFHLLTDPTPILDGEAVISNPDMIVYEPVTADASLGLSGFAQTADGTKGLQTGATQPATTLTFLDPVTAFGAYWGAETFGGPSTVSVDFYNSAHSLVASESFAYDHEATGDGGLDWHGWQFDAPIAALTFTGPNVVVDGLQATAVPEPGSLALLVSVGMGGLGLLLRRR